jgi:uncharacterized repeat protein (TIGR01451 family)
VRRAFPLLAILMTAAGCSGDGLFRREETARGQFGPFGSTPARLDLTPTTAAVATKKDVLFVATVYDKDGSPLRRKSVEWSIEGPGEFVVVDDGGFLTRRGRSVGMKSATTSTHNFEERLDKKTYSATAEEPLIRPGQTWVVVSSAVEGKTVVTAMCPDVADRDKGRMTATVIWGDADFGFPPPAVVPAGGETQLRTDLSRAAAAATAGGFRVRYRILGGAAATLVPGGEGVTSLTGGNPQDVTTNATADGSAPIKIVQAAPFAGKTRVGIEVIKPDPNGVGPGTVVGRNETSVEWASSQLTLDLRGPGTVGEGRDVTYSLVVANAGKAASPPVTLRATLPNTVSVVAAEPPSDAKSGRDQTWNLPAVGPGESREVRLTVKPVRRGAFEIAAVAGTPDGLRAEQKIAASAEASSIGVALTGPAFAPVGEPMPVRVTVTNTGAVAVDNVTAWVTGGEGLTADGRAPGEPIEVTLGTIAPGQSQSGEVFMTAGRAGAFGAKATVTADGGLTGKAEAKVEARTAGLAVDVAGPDRVGVGESAAYAVKVKNTGDMALSSVVVRAELPRGLNATGADGGAISGSGGFVTWTLPTLAAGETKLLKLAAAGDRAGPPATLAATATVKGVGTKPLEIRTTAPVAVSGLPALELELADPSGPVPVGGKATYRVTVRNRGTGAARDVRITVEVPGEMTAVRGRAASGRDATVEDTRLTFPPLPSLAAGSAVTVYADLEAVRPGSARVRAVVTGPDLPSPVREEQATRVTGNGK